MLYRELPSDQHQVLKDFSNTMNLVGEPVWTGLTSFHLSETKELKK